MKPNTLLAIWGGKLAMAMSRRLGKGGSTLPGTVARRIDPGLLRSLAANTPRGVITVSGTNGKTTTAKMLSDILTAGQLLPVHNRAGANLINGLTAAFLQSSTWTGRVRGNVALMEVDEATMPKACPELRPRVAVVTNFFRDQLDRYGELETTVQFVRRGLVQIPKTATMALNADDPLVASLGDAGSQVLYYGLEDTSVGVAEWTQTADAKHCRNCGSPYEYKVYYYAHLGKYRCPKCGQGRPQPSVYVDQVLEQTTHGTRVHMVTPKGDLTVKLRIPGLYNVYNALAAAAGALAIGMDLKAIQAGLEATTTSFGRMESFQVGDREVFMALVKNPVGFNEVVRTLLTAGERKNVMICINDLYADGTDVSWLWDVDFEQLGRRQEEVAGLICAGTRAEDMAVRLKYAGVDPGRITTISGLEQALDAGLQRVAPGELLYILPTYTAMLGMRDIIARRGYARQFWEV